ncbi:restriction endonuclease subunit S [Aeromonas caviae]
MMAEQMIHHKEGEKVATQAIPTGFKQSEVGIIPEDWLVEPLENFTSFISYGFTNPMPTTASGPYMVTARDISNGKIQYDSARTTDWSAFHKLLTAKSKPQLDDVLLTKDGTLGRVALVENELICINQSVAILRPNKRIYPKFFKCLLDAPLYQAKMLEDAGGSTIKHIYITIVNKMVLGLPANLTEQTAIANVLSDSDALIDSLELLIAKKQSVKTATMQQLLTGRTRLPQFALRPDGSPKGYKLSELGDIPEDWEIKQIIQFTDCTAGGTPSTSIASYWGGEHPWMSSGELHLKRVFDVSVRITDEGLGNSSTKYVPADSVLIGLAGQGKTRGTVAIAKIPLCTNQSIASIFPSAEHCPEFLFYNLDSRYEELRELSTGDGGRGGLNLAIIRRLKVIFPDKTEQSAIANVLSDMDSELTELEQKLAKARDVKQGMMQQLLTGRIRLPLPQEA